MSTETIATSTETLIEATTAAGEVVQATTDEVKTIGETVVEATEGASDLTTKILIGAGVLVGAGLGYLGYRGIRNLIVSRSQAEAPAATTVEDPVQPPAEAAAEKVKPATVRPVEPEAPAQAQA